MGNKDEQIKLHTRIDTNLDEIKLINSRQEDIKLDISRLREEQGELYKLFTKNDDKIVADYIDNKEKTNNEIALFKTRMSLFDNEVHKLKNKLEHQNNSLNGH